MAPRDHIGDSIHAISEIHARDEGTRTLHQRGIERVTFLIARPGALYVMVGAVLAWFLANLLLPHIGSRAFDRPPFPLLQGILALSSLLRLARPPHENQYARKANFAHEPAMKIFSGSARCVGGGG